MLSDFPKTRPPLPQEIVDIYATHYKKNRGGDTIASSLSQRMEAFMHRSVAADTHNISCERSTLEIGAGTLNQLQYETKIGPYDIVEPFVSLFEDSPNLSKIRNVFSDTNNIPRTNRYDRITSIAAFEHICNLPEVVARCALMLNENGNLRVSIPSEGTLLWSLGWKLTTGLEFRLKYNLDYGLLMKHEHVNTAAQVELVLRYFFNDVAGRYFGIGRRLSLYQTYVCQSPRIDNCYEYLESLS